MLSLVSCVAAALAVAGRAESRSYALSKTYDASNFFDEFDFQTTGTHTDQPDDNWSWVTYQTKTDAINKGLAAVKNGQVYLGVDYTNTLPAQVSGPGRPTLRLSSKNSFKHGLVITTFSHLPQPVCGGWPGFWTVGTGQWPTAGEVDLYEGWHLAPNNKVALHVGPSSAIGQCTLDQSSQNAQVLTGNCDNTFEDGVHQWANQGCQSEETQNGIWGSPQGGIQALEWTSDFIKIYTWPIGSAPSNIASAQPDTSSWGTPSVQLEKPNCDTETAFSDQKLLFTLPFCGNPPGNDQFWSALPADGKSGATCKSITGEATCVDYVAKNPQAFKNFYFGIKDIRIFNEVIQNQLSLDGSSPSFTFNYATSQASGDNWIGIWPAGDAKAPQSGSSAWAYASKSSGSVLITPSSSMTAGSYKAYLLAGDRTILGTVSSFTYAGGSSAAFTVKPHYSTGCAGSANNAVDVQSGGGMCLNTNCGVGSLDIAAAGSCPSGQVRLSYWQGQDCAGDWYGYGYASRGTCRGLWSDGWNFQSLWLSCADPKDDCVAKGTCAAAPEPSVGVCRASFALKTRYNSNCGGAVHNDVTVAQGGGTCIDTDCAVGSLEVAGTGSCPDGQLRISYWEKGGCSGKWFGYGYGSRNQCRSLWSGGWGFKSLYVTCGKQSDDCVSRGTCTADQPGNSVC
ncbi:Concanavalin A-like lectin/glucanase [Cordyceps fumosorosea ARSEF 2679]|uniref:Concanavalin A-like lectin/glucanase n=1 Tax=Cordyceps fumosorosea (strain ARSEF 2679) TaxID=1081104 RepID=A0A167KSJ6_CORFA|nr:Concanavalin A-like lectin/glucanase [Cordyceps fumosorosea ARSEF 2679]OAA52132.1 Concanavalin A-like lectin/glucanase [Cordyceps fumosorosea ARSEF 2679]